MEAFEMLMASYRSSGQKLGKLDHQYTYQNQIRTTCYTHEADSLSSKYNNFYVNQCLEKLEMLCNASIQVTTLGKYDESLDDVCSCKSSSCYILRTDYITVASPLYCGDCDKHLPLYKLPIYQDYGYMPILSWESNYVSCDTLQMNCEVGERWALNQMQQVQSALSKQGRSICTQIEALTKIPTHYYLHNYRPSRKQIDELCRNCGENWELPAPTHHLYHYKCDKCRLVSTKSRNI
ncbi:MAG: hypothetical protein RL329_2750 [Bacteroidota bacterium]